MKTKTKDKQQQLVEKLNSSRQIGGSIKSNTWGWSQCLENNILSNLIHNYYLECMPSYSLYLESTVLTYHFTIYIYACMWRIHLKPHMANSYKTHLGELQWVYLHCLLHLGGHHFALASLSPAFMQQWFHNSTRMIETIRNLLSCCRSHVALDMTQWPKKISPCKCARALSD